LRELMNPLLGSSLNPGIDCIIKVGDLQFLFTLNLQSS
jgi:hypothetical protein